MAPVVGRTRLALPWRASIEQVLEEPWRLRPVFQPIFDLERGVACGFELLARFESERVAPPPDWFAAAAAHGLGARLEALVVRAGREALSSLPPDCFLTINLGPDALLAPEVQAELLGAGALDRLVVEVTENAPVDDYPRLLEVLDRLRDRHGMLAVDDAGAGYASLSHITQLRPQFVKLDRGLVQDLDRDPVRHALVETVGSLAGRLDAWLVAEGVERPGEREALQRLGVPLAQGFGLARPGELALPRPVTAASRRVVSGVASLVERSVAAVREGEEVAAGHRLAVVVDARHRPLALLVRGDDGAWNRHDDLLRIHETERLDHLAERFLTRPEAARFLPACCVSEQGRLTGVLSFEQLVRGLSRRYTPNTEESHP